MGSFNVIAGALGTNRLRPLNVSLASQALLLDLKLFYRFLACLQLMVQFTDFGLEFRIVLGNLPGLSGGFTQSAFGRSKLCFKVCYFVSKLLVCRLQLLILGLNTGQTIQ